MRVFAVLYSHSEQLSGHAVQVFSPFTAKSELQVSQVFGVVQELQFAAQFISQAPALNV